MVEVIGKQDSVFNQFLSELRDQSVQLDSARFRLNLERLGEIFAYEISKTFDYLPREIVTPLGISQMNLPAEQVVLATILRAGLPLHQGLLRFFDQAGSAFVSAYRKYTKDEKFRIKLDYVSSPAIEGKILVISDPMLATGGSAVASLKGLLEAGSPKHIHVVSALATREAIDLITRNLSRRSFTIWTGAIDDELTAQAYIVPGLGDAGDLAYGKKEE